jgi:hypothetical protein
MLVTQLSAEKMALVKSWSRAQISCRGARRLGENRLKVAGKGAVGQSCRHFDTVAEEALNGCYDGQPSRKAL